MYVKNKKDVCLCALAGEGFILVSESAFLLKLRVGNRHVVTSECLEFKFFVSKLSTFST